MFQLLKRSLKAKLAVGAVGLAIVAWLAFGFFGIQAAFIDNRVNEANPFATTGVSQPVVVEGEQAQSSDAVAVPETQGDGPAAEAVEPAVEAAAPATVPEVVTLASGSLVDHAHAGDGTINVLSDGERRVLRFEDDFDIDNGPDLNVYLVRGADAEGDPGLFDDDFIDLGDLKGNIGAQNYNLPDDVDLSEYDTVVIWCVRFGVAFNAANLS